MAIDYHAHPVLVVDDEPDILMAFRLAYEDDFDVLTAESGEQALALLAEHDVAAIVADQRMPSMSGTEFLIRSMHVKPSAVRMILTGYTDIDVLVEAINKSEIHRYVTKPWDHQDMRIAIRNAIDRHHLQQENARLTEALRIANERLAAENEYLRQRDASDVPPDGIVGHGAAMRDVFRLVDKVAASTTTVLLRGETGTGKELLARAIHARSDRKDRLFVAVNCAALSENLLESELFGHRRGAFTGALSDKKGLFEVAHGGTLFLDEVGETSPGMQAKLLRVLQEGEILPVGETRPKKIDVRVVAATHRDLEAEVQAGRFRSDLYYRLRVFPIRVPALRDRRDDIPALAAFFCAKHAGKLGKPVRGIAADAMDRLVVYGYPGNVRELENEIERAVLLAEPGEEITAAELSEDFAPDPDDPGAPPPAESRLRGRTDAIQRVEIQNALAKAGGRKALAAQELGMTYRGLLKAMHRLGLVERDA